MDVKQVGASYDDRQAPLTGILEDIRSRFCWLLEDPGLRSQFEEVLRDLRADFFTVVVVGEFKRGKSTLVNALLGTALLPVGTTPTTAAIHVLRWGKPSIVVHGTDGSSRSLPWEEQALERFVADAEFDHSTIAYVDIKLPSPLLRHRVVLVDTPGVADLNRQRADITYRFIPRADAVIFLLDATAPVRRTEQVFLEEEILKSGIDRILFVANFKDQVDPEDLPGLEGAIRNRLTAVLGREVNHLYLVSARQALLGRLANDSVLVRESGIMALEAGLGELLEDGVQSSIKLARHAFRLRALLTGMKLSVQHRIELKNASIDELEAKLAELHKAKGRSAKRRVELDEYVRDRKAEILAMVCKSLHHMGDNLRDDVRASLDAYQGPDFKNFVETSLPRMIKQRIRGWAESSGDAIETLLLTLERELVDALAREFDVARTALGVTRAQSDTVQGEAILTARDVSQAMLTAGLIAGGLGVVTLLIAGPFVPLVGMLPYPLLHRRMLEKSLAEAKAEVKPQLEQVLNDVLGRFEEGVVNTIGESIDRIHQAAAERLDDLLSGFERRMESEVAARRADAASSAQEQEKLRQALHMLEEMEAALADALGPMALSGRHA